MTVTTRNDHPVIELWPVDGLTRDLESYCYKSHNISLSRHVFLYVVARLRTLLEQAQITTGNRQWWNIENYWIDYSYLAYLLTNYLYQLEIQNNSRLAKTFGASAAGDCLFGRSLPLVGVIPEKPFKAEWVLSARVGDFAHAALQELMTDAGDIVIMQPSYRSKKEFAEPGAIMAYSAAIEVSLDLVRLPEKLSTLMIDSQSSCRIDFIRKGKKGALIGDIKTNDEKYWQERGNWPGWYEQKKQHWALQVCNGIYLWRDDNGKQAVNGLILEVGRGFKFREWLVNYTEECEEWFDREFEQVKQAKIKVDLVRERKSINYAEELYPPVGGPECKFCPKNYKAVCPLPENEKQG
jgi:hypothetical protein